MKIVKCLKRCDRKISELKGLEAEKEEEESDQDEFEETQAQLVKEFAKVDTANSEHIDVCFEIQKMANFMLESDVDVSEADNKNKQDARKFLEASEQHEEQTDSTVLEWKKGNSKWFKKKKKRKNQELVEVGSLCVVGGGVENLQDHPRHSVAQSRRHEWRAPLGQQEAGGVRRLRHLHENKVGADQEDDESQEYLMQVYKRLGNMGPGTSSRSRIFDDNEIELTVREWARKRMGRTKEIK